MKTGSFEHLQECCASKGIVCERRGKKIELTTPDGATTAEEMTVRDAWDTYRRDPAFCELPIRLNCKSNEDVPAKVEAPKPERYRYRFLNSLGEVHREVECQHLGSAMEQAGFVEDWRVIYAFPGMAVIQKYETGATIGVKWERV